jgi:hypothetical protein
MILKNAKQKFLPKELNYTTAPLVRIDWDNESSGYAENPDNWIFL